jgi:hypothetical protein
VGLETELANAGGTSISDLFAGLSALAAAVGLAFAGVQLRAGRKTTRAQFLTEIHRMFLHYDAVHKKLEGAEEADIAKQASAARNWNPTGAEWSDIRAYMGLFERLWILSESGVIDMSTLERLYGYRMRNVVRNDALRSYLLCHRLGWSDFLRCWEEMNRANTRRTGKEPEFPVPPD